MMKLFFLTLLCSVMAAVHADDLMQTDCQPENGITPICGFSAPEDLDDVTGMQALVVGSLGGVNFNDSHATQGGDIRILYLDTLNTEKVYPPGLDAPAVSEGPAWGSPDCPGPPAEFSAHGLHVSANKLGSHTLLVVNHAGRESIEWLELNKNGTRITARWRGCVMVDEPYWVNDVAILDDGGLIASHMMPREQAGTLLSRPTNDRVESGFVLEWHADSGWQKIPGSEGALPNGIAISADNKVVYSNHYLANQLVAIERATGKRLWTAALNGAPDNLSVRPDGDLLVATHLVDLATIRDQCLLRNDPICKLPFVISSVDSTTGAVSPVIESAGRPFGGSTVAVEYGDYIYMGSFSGNRIGRIPVPR